ncbi:hypothetical protein OG345_28375 [Streptomyces sp. NBC_01220]|uniref:hypothetical protein n=1 Tax=unclassified Streptomyces TaxID=2593676 RepID=UPI002E2E59EF|nr:MULTISPECIES: hypothetical protein [unclassified Streptomyces]WSQ46625.1 hypothetical protein OG345_28375 [Streptomyces sp. NBC_01220]
MGVYDRLFVPAPSPCPRCGSQEDLVIQFHFGDVYLHKFRVGDTIAWSDRAEGSPRTGRFEVPGYPEWCKQCGLDDEGFCLVQFDGDVITGYRRAVEEDMEKFDW